MKRPLKMGCVLLVSVIFVTAAFAAKKKVSASPQAFKVLSQMRVLARQHQFSAAFALAQKNESHFNNDPRFNYLHALTAIRVQRPEIALPLFLALKQEYPHNPRLQLEYAYTQYALHHYPLAKQELLAVLKLNPPLAVQKNIHHLLQRIDSQEKMPLQVVAPTRDARAGHLAAKVRFATGLDSNINASPTQDIISIPLLGPIRLNASAKATPSSYYQIQPGLNGSKAINDKVAIFGSVISDLRQNLKAHAFDTTSMTATMGVSVATNGYNISVPVLAAKTLLSGRNFMNIFSTGTQVLYNWDKQTKVGGFIIVGKTFYPGTKNAAGVYFQDARQLMVGGLWQHQFAQPKLDVNVKIFCGKDTPKYNGFPFVGRKFWGMEDYFRWKYSQRAAPFIFLRAQHADYGGAVPGFLKTRRDTDVSLSVGVDYKLSRHWTLSPAYLYQKNASNTSIYSYHKHVLIAGLTFDADIF